MKLGVTQQEVLDYVRRNSYATWYELANLKPRAYAHKSFGWPGNVVDTLRAKGLVKYSHLDVENLTEMEKVILAVAQADHPKAASFVLLAQGGEAE